jgi:hypothetical protein
VGSSTFRPLFIPGMAPVTSRPTGPHHPARPGAVNVRRMPANAAEHDQNVIIRHADGTCEPVRPAYNYDVSYMKRRPAPGPV